MEIKVSPADERELNSVKKREDIPVVYPNMPRNNAISYNGRFQRGQYCSVEECTELSEFCLDVGVLNLFGQNPYDFIVGLGDKLKVVILRDNNGVEDAHLLPFSSIYAGGRTSQWSLVFKALNTIKFDGTIIIDCWDSMRVLPVMLRKPYMEYVRAMCDYIRWSLSMDQLVAKHEKRVLFGAGNMCRNYMLMYGEEFPPLFTCDNNSARWGQMIDGLEIKNPEVLKDLDSDVTIYICNMYYEQIMLQLRDMGITNPIEFFSDEYLPEEHVDRMKMWEG